MDIHKKGNTKMKYIFFKIIYSFCCIISMIFTLLVFHHYMFYHLFLNAMYYCVIFFASCLVPIIFLLLLKYLSEKFNFKKYLNILLEIIVTVITLFYFFIMLIVQGFTSVAVGSDTSIPLSIYNYELSILKKEVGPEKLSHFPENIPKDVKNYKFLVDIAWDGSTYYLTFYANELQADNIFKQHKDSCRFIDNTFKKYPSIYINQIKERSKSCFFTIKDGTQEYTSGIIWDGIDNRIYYYYYR